MEKSARLRAAFEPDRDYSNADVVSARRDHLGGSASSLSSTTGGAAHCAEELWRISSSFPHHPPYFPVALFLFVVSLGVARAGIATAQTVESNQRVFDVASIIRNAPLLGTSLDLSWQELGGAINGLRVEGAVDFRTIFRLGLDVTRLYQRDSDHDVFVTRGSVRGLVLVPLDRLSLVMGGGWTWRKTFDPASGPASYLAVDYRPIRPLTLDMASETSFTNRRLDRTLDLGVSVGIDLVRLRAGYRWLSMGLEDFSGPTIGLGTQF